MSTSGRFRKDSLLFLFAGILFGLVAGFILTREHYERKRTGSTPAVRPSPHGTAAPSSSGMPAQPEQHDRMISQFIEQAKEPDNYEDKVKLGDIYYDLGNFEKALTWYEASLALNDANADVLVDLGVCYRSLNEADKALEMFDRALEVEGNKKEALYNSAVVYFFDRGDVDEALSILGKLERLFPGDPAVGKLKAEIEKTKGA